MRLSLGFPRSRKDWNASRICGLTLSLQYLWSGFSIDGGAGSSARGLRCGVRIRFDNHIYGCALFEFGFLTFVAGNAKLASINTACFRIFLHGRYRRATSNARTGPMKLCGLSRLRPTCANTRQTIDGFLGWSQDYAGLVYKWISQKIRESSS